MVKIYYNLIVAGQWSIDNVPVRWRVDVKVLLDADVSA
ncbi:MAG: CD1375 family protein [Candidatus Pristimantibacillus sp.]